MCIVHGSWNKKINHFLTRSDTGVMEIYTQNECHTRDTFASEIFMFSPRVGGSCQQSAATGYRVGSSTKGNRLTLSVVWCRIVSGIGKRFSSLPNLSRLMISPHLIISYIWIHTRAHTPDFQKYIYAPICI